MRRRAALVALALTTAACGGSYGPVAAGGEAEPAAFGTAHPGAVEFYDPAGRWMVLCQAREDTDHDGRIEAAFGAVGTDGDRVREWLVVGGGAGVDIGLLLAVDPSFRYLVGWIEPDRMVLYETRLGVQLELARHASASEKKPEEEPFAAFEPGGRRLVYGRVGRHSPAWLRVRDLATGVETPVDPGPGAIFRPQLAPDGRWVALTVVEHDEDGDGWLAPWYRPEAYFVGGCGKGHCCVPDRGDHGIARILEVGGKRRFDLPAVEAFVGDRWIVRRGPSLSLEGADGAAEEIAKDAAVLAVDEATGSFLFAGGGRAFLHDPLRTRDVGSTGVFAALERDEPDPTSWKLRAPHVFDWSSGRLLDPRGTVIGGVGPRWLIERDDGLFVADVRSGTERAVPAVGTLRWRWPEPFESGDCVGAGGLVFDLARAVTIGSYETDRSKPEGVVLGLRADGALLRADHPVPGHGRFSGGPFRWRKPDPPK